MTFIPTLLHDLFLRPRCLIHSVHYFVICELVTPLFLANLAKRPFDFLPSLGVGRLLTFHIWIFSFETAWQNEPKLGKKLLWKVLYKECSFSSNWTKNMVNMGNSCFWFAEILKIFSSEARRHNELLLCRNDIWEILYKISLFRADHTTNMAVNGSSCLWLAC